MKAGNVNFLVTQGAYQKTPNITFRDKKWKYPGKVYEVIMLKLLFYMAILKLFHFIFTYTTKCLL